MARPFGATTRPQFYTYTTEQDRKDYAIWIKKNYKKDSQLAKWYGDQMYGKAPQPIIGDPLLPLFINFDNSFNATPPETKGSSN